MRFLALSASLTLGIVSLAACGDPEPAGAGGDLQDVVWQMTSATIDGSTVEPIMGAPATITFGVEDAVGGVAACNSYGGTVVFDGASSSIVLSTLTQTEMGCLDEGVMDLEAAFLGALTRVTAYTLTADMLVLEGPGVAMRFAAQPPEPDAALVGVTWALQTIIRGEAASTPVAQGTLVFSDDGAVAGTAGCNSIGGTYDPATGFGQMVSTMMACEPAVMEQERFFMDVLSDQATVSIEGPTLTIADLSGNALVFRAG
jgi:heat shock protein HslJ